MNAVLYVRCSTNKQELEHQENVLKEFCKKQNYEVIEIYRDIVSGKLESRPEFDRMFNDARKLKFDIVLFWNLDRFSRAGIVHTLQRLRELSKLGIKWKSYSEPYFSTMGEFSEVFISFIAKLNEIEARKISERTKLSYQLKKDSGKGWGKRGKDKKKRIRRYRRKPKD